VLHLTAWGQSSERLDRRAALTVLPDGRLVVAWAPMNGEIMVRVEAKPPES
jgi:hypothetical protein